MKNKLVLLFILLSSVAFSQVSVEPNHVGSKDNFKKGAIDKLKKTTTVFVLSSVYDKEEYEEILDEIWTITPFLVVNKEDFNLNDFLTNEYSFTNFAAEKLVIEGNLTTATRLSVYLQFYSFDYEKLLPKLEKMKKSLAGKSVEKRNEKIEKLLKKNQKEYAVIMLHLKDNFIEKAVSEPLENIVSSIYYKDVFYNYNLGMLKNYFQKVNNTLVKNETAWLYDKDYKKELKNLTTQTLFVPEYITIRYDGFSGEDSEMNNKKVIEALDKYQYNYEIIKPKKLTERILSGEEFYYLRYVRVNAERFLQVVNSKTGEIVYQDYMIGIFSYNLKPKYFKELNAKIKKAKKGSRFK